MCDNYFFQSISKFVEGINQTHTDVDKAFLYFEGNELFKNKYEKQCMKPIFIELIDKKNNSTYISHKEILDIYDGQLVVSYNENNKRKIDPIKKNSLFKMTIYFEKKQFNGNTYYNSIIREVNNTKNRDKIRDQVTDFVYVENDLPEDAFIDIA